MSENNIDISLQWYNYITSLDTKLTNMWNFILYQNFTDNLLKDKITEINELKDKYNRERNYSDDLRIDVKYYRDFRDKLDKKVKNLEKQIKDLKNPTLKRKRNNENDFINKVKSKKPSKYKYMKKNELEKNLSKIFENLNGIDDIIKLKNIEKIHDYFKSEKFTKLYQLIPSLEKLNNMIGLNNIKEQVYSMICYCLHQMNSDEDLNHIVIMGPPGVGKTSVAHLLGDIYRGLGFLSNDTFLKARRSDLIAEYLGQTAIKTQKMIDKAEGGVLFIDEVYSLGNPEKRDSFAKECIDTINQNLTEKSKNLLVIIAGYKDEVKKCFFSYNPGLERRFPLQFTIEKYSDKELYQILLRHIKTDKFSITNKCEGYCLEEIKENYELFEYMGGDMHTLLKFAKENYSKRLMKTLLSLTSTKQLVKKDFEYAFERFKKNRVKNVDKIPESVMGMYV